MTRERRGPNVGEGAGRRTPTRSGATTMPVSAWMVDAIAPQPGQTVLELAAGIGDTGFLAAELIEPGGTLITSDVVAGDARRAAQRRAEALGIRNVELQADRRLSRSTSRPRRIDAVLCRWGYMLMADPEAALRETRRVLRPGGRVALAAWTAAEDNPWCAVPVELLIERGLVDPTEPGRPGPVRLGATTASSRSTSRRRASSSTRSRPSTSRSATRRSTTGGTTTRVDGRRAPARRPDRRPRTSCWRALASAARRLDRRRRLAGDPRPDVGRGRDGLTCARPCSTTTTPISTCSTARPSPSSATAPRATPTR